MATTIIATLMLMLAYFLLLYAGVGFIQDKRLFSSAPQEILEVLPKKQERFKGAHTVGWIIAFIAVATFMAALIIGIADGIKNNFNFISFFVRFIIMIYGMELFDIGFFDWVLLSHSNFFPHFYPEVKDIIGPHLFGFNKKTHVMHFIIYIPVCAVLAFICTLI